MIKKSIVLLLTVLLAISILLNTVYRDFIYKEKINDFGIADMGYNIFAVTLISLLSWIGLFKFTNNKIKDILLNTLLLITIEISSSLFPIFGTYDYKDLIALTASCFLTIGLLYLVDKKSFLDSMKNLLI